MNEDKPEQEEKRAKQCPGKAKSHPYRRASFRERWRKTTIGHQIETIIGALGLIALGIYTLYQVKSYYTQQEDRNLVAAERAWVNIQGVKGHVLHDPGWSHIALTFLIRNSGHSPATNVSVHMDRGVFPKPFPCPPIVSPGRGPSQDVLPPDIEGNPLTYDEHIPPEGSAHILRGDGFMTFWGTIYYKDIFLKDRWTRFCYRIEPGYDGIKPCECYNELK